MAFTRLRGGPQTLVKNVWRRQQATKVVIRTSSAHLAETSVVNMGRERARYLVNYTLSWPSPWPLGRPHTARRRACEPFVCAPEAPWGVRGGLSAFTDSVLYGGVIGYQSRHPNLHYTLQETKWRERGKRAPSLVNHMLSWPSPWPLGRRHKGSQARF